MIGGILVRKIAKPGEIEFVSDAEGKQVPRPAVSIFELICGKCSCFQIFVGHKMKYLISDLLSSEWRVLLTGEGPVVSCPKCEGGSIRAQDSVSLKPIAHIESVNSPLSNENSD